MAKLHSTLENGRGNTVESSNNTVAHVMCETWQVRITTVLQPDGKYTVLITDRNTDVVIEKVTGQYPLPGNSLEAQSCAYCREMTTRIHVDNRYVCKECADFIS